MLNNENKTYDQKKISQSCFVDFQLTFLHWRNAVSCTLKIEQAIKKKSGIKLLINKAMINPIFPTLLKYEIEKWGQWCKFRDKGQNLNLKIRV